MSKAPTRKEIAAYLHRLRTKVEREECYSCDCLHGFLMQLQLDIDEDMGDLFDAFAVPRSMLHPCMGCVPCFPGELYSEYILKQQTEKAG